MASAKRKSVYAGPFDPVTNEHAYMIRAGTRLDIGDAGLPLDIGWTKVSYGNPVGVRHEGGAR